MRKHLSHLCYYMALMNVEGFDITSRYNTDHQPNLDNRCVTVTLVTMMQEDCSRSLGGCETQSTYIGYTHSDHVTCTHAVQYTTQYCIYNKSLATAPNIIYEWTNSIQAHIPNQKACYIHMNDVPQSSLVISIRKAMYW